MSIHRFGIYLLVSASLTSCGFGSGDRTIGGDTYYCHCNCMNQRSFRYIKGIYACADNINEAVVACSNACADHLGKPGLWCVLRGIDNPERDGEPEENVFPIHKDFCSTSGKPPPCELEIEGPDGGLSECVDETGASIEPLLDISGASDGFLGVKDPDDPWVGSVDPSRSWMVVEHKGHITPQLSPISGRAYLDTPACLHLDEQGTDPSESCPVRLDFLQLRAPDFTIDGHDVEDFVLQNHGLWYGHRFANDGYSFMSYIQAAIGADVEGDWTSNLGFASGHMGGELHTTPSVLPGGTTTEWGYYMTIGGTFTTEDAETTVEYFVVIRLDEGAPVAVVRQDWCGTNVCDLNGSESYSPAGLPITCTWYDAEGNESVQQGCGFGEWIPATGPATLEVCDSRGVCSYKEYRGKPLCDLDWNEDGWVTFDDVIRLGGGISGFAGEWFLATNNPEIYRSHSWNHYVSELDWNKDQRIDDADLVGGISMPGGWGFYAQWFVLTTWPSLYSTYFPNSECPPPLGL